MNMNSITYRITGLMFLLITITVFILVYLANQQMVELFHNYLLIQHMGHGSMMGHMRVEQSIVMKMMGMPEKEFLMSVHQTLIWVGAGILMVGLLVSYFLARSITVPLRKLGVAVEQIEKGNIGHKVEVETKDEVGHLAIAFNRMTAALEANNRLRQRLLADVAHELKTPLAVIQGHLEAMLDEVVDLNKSEIASLYEETTYLNRLIKDLRDLSLAEAGQLKLTKTNVNVNQIICRAIQMLKPLADEKEITIEHHLHPVKDIVADAGRINQVIYNLLTNALRYTPIKGVIKASTSIVKKGRKLWLEIKISDSGQGITPEDLPYIFNHFYRADQSRDRKSGGSGIGLAIVKQLVEIHGGSVEVESEVGKGSIFCIYLPAKN